MNKQTELAQSLDALVDVLKAALDQIDTTLATMDGAQLFDTLCFVRKYGDLRDAHHRIFLEKLEASNASHSARSDHSLDIYLQRPDAPYRLGWMLSVMDGHVDVICKQFATFEEGKAAGDALFEFLCISDRMGTFEHEPPRPSGAAQTADPDAVIPF